MSYKAILFVLCLIFSLSLSQTYVNIVHNSPSGLPLAATIVPPSPFTLQLLPLGVNDPNQLWTIDEYGFIISKSQPNYTFDITDYDTTPGTQVGVYLKKDPSDSTSYNQRWIAEGSILSQLSQDLYIKPKFAADGSNSGVLIIDSCLLVQIQPPSPKPVVCSSTGDPHISPFYNNGLDLYTPGVQAPGDYVLAIFGDTQVVEGQQVCGPSNNVYCNFNLSVSNGPNKVSITGDSVKVNSIPTVVTSTLTVGNLVIKRTGYGAYTITVPEGYVTVQPNGAVGYDNTQDIQVVVNYAPTPLKGLCGAPNTTSESIDTFVKAWQTTYDVDPFDYASYEAWLLANPPSYDSFNGTVGTTDPTLLANATSLCSALQYGPLVNQCAPLYDPTPYHQACLDDVILTGSLAFAQSTINAYFFKCKATLPGNFSLVLPTSPITSIAFGPGLAANVTALVPTNFTIQAKDAFGDDITIGGDIFLVTSTGPAPLFFSIIDNLNGQYSVFYTAAVAGTYTIYVTGLGANILDSPFTINVVGIPIIQVTDPALSTASGPGVAATIPAAESVSFTITARTSAGTQRTSGGDTININYGGFVLRSSVVDNGDGTYTATYEQEFVGPFTIRVFINGGEISGSPFAVTSTI